MELQERELDQIFAALAHPTRRAIVHTLSRKEQTVQELAAPHAMSLNAISKHLKKLEAAGLVARRIDGNYHRMNYKAETMKAAMDWMARYQQFWGLQLSNLKTHLETTDEP